jgi:hypothetical protein
MSTDSLTHTRIMRTHDTTHLWAVCELLQAQRIGGFENNARHLHTYTRVIDAVCAHAHTEPFFRNAGSFFESLLSCRTCT